MKEFIKIILYCLIVILPINSNSLEERAFNAYKDRDYITSIRLYTSLARQNNLKAFLMLGLFYERGVGVAQNKSRAIRLYKLILKRTKNIKKLLTNRDYKDIEITIKALERLYVLTNKKHYKELALKLKELEKSVDLSKTELFNTINSKRIDDFLILCPKAKLVAPKDREGIEEFDCSLFEKFPKKMATFMKLRALKFELLKDKNLNKDTLSRLESLINEVTKPIIDYLQQDVVNCYVDSQKLSDIYSCNYDYLVKSDPLLFRNYSYEMEKYLTTNRLKDYILGNLEKESIVKRLIFKISKGMFGNEWKDMVK